MTKSDNNASVERPPVVVVMGHVDHGKSTLLDFIRHTNKVAGEAGGITQHVAAYEVIHTRDSVDKKITFIDTPGHAAFSAIRARGANVADIAILVVAADDGVKAQTLEALAQIREAKIPFIVAINKIDKPNANVERTQTSLSEHDVFLEKLGGDVPWVAISAKVGTGVTELLDLILLVAEFADFKSDPTLPGRGYVIEAHRDQKRGIAATLIVTEGTLETGMSVLAGHAITPIRIMENSLGKTIKTASFSSPITLTGFDELPHVGEAFLTYKTKRDAETARDTGDVAVVHKDPSTIATDARTFHMPVIIRADASGSLEAIEHETSKIGDEHAVVSIVQSGIGNISENDVKSAMAGEIHATLIGFNVDIDPIAQALAQQHNVAIETFAIIYKLTEHLTERLAERKPKRVIEEITGRARIIRQFSREKELSLVGGAVIEGYIAKTGIVRIIRRKVVIGTGKIISLQQAKQNVLRVDTGFEFGTQIDAKFEIAEGDIIENVISTTI